MDEPGAASTPAPPSPGVALSATAPGGLAEPPAGASPRLGGGALSVAGGLILLGLGSYAFLALAARALRPELFSSLSVLYTLCYGIGPALFLPLEQEIARIVAHRREQGDGVGAAVRAVTRFGVLSTGAGMVVVVPVAAGLLGPLLGGERGLLLALAVALPALCAAYLSRGVLAGEGRFPAYGVQLGIEGVARAAACVLLAAAGVHAVTAYGLLVPLGLVAGVLVTAPSWRRRGADGPAVGPGETASALGKLVVASTGAQLVANGPVVAAQLLAGAGERVASGRVLAALVLTRLPLFAFTAVQAALLPALAAAVGRGDRAGFGRSITRLLGGVVVLTAVAVALGATVGPAVLRLSFGTRLASGPGVVSGLCVGAGAYVLAAATGQALVALNRHAEAALAWTGGALAFLAALALPVGLEARVVSAFVAGSVVAAAGQLGLLASAAHRHTVVSS